MEIEDMNMEDMDTEDMDMEDMDMEDMDMDIDRPGSRPEDDIGQCRQAHLRLIELVSGLGDGDVRGPSLLPDWSRAHVLSHLARNADSVVRRLSAAVRGELVEQYPGGGAERRAQIEDGSRRGASEIFEDLTQASAAVDEAFASLPDECWSRMVLAGGVEHPAADLPFRRWREVDVHLVDLGIGYLASDWPEPLLVRWLPSLLPGLASRCDARQLMAWALGRGAAPPVEPF